MSNPIVDMLREVHQMEIEIDLKVCVDGSVESIYKGNSLKANFKELITPYVGKVLTGYEIYEDAATKIMCITIKMEGADHD